MENLDNLLITEYEKKQQDREELEEKIKALPKGYIQPKKIRGKIYHYLQFRKGKQVKSQYIPADKLPEMERNIEERKKLEEQLKKLIREEEDLAMMLGRHVNYRPVKDIDIDEYARFISSVVRDYKNMDQESFLEKYKPALFEGIQKKYVKGFTDWIKGTYKRKIRKGNTLVLDPYTYYMYFVVEDKSVLAEELKYAIPEFLNQGLLITEIEENAGDAK